MERRCYDKRQIALKRAESLRDTIADYLKAKESIPRGMGAAEQEKYERQKAKILAHLGATEENWNDYKWQLKNRIFDLDTLLQIIKLEDDEVQAVREVGEQFRWGISPYYLALIDKITNMIRLSFRPFPPKQSSSWAARPTPWVRNTLIPLAVSPDAIQIGDHN